MPNTCDSLQKSVDWCEGTPVLPGIRKRLYYINKKLIVQWPTLTKNSIGQATNATYTGNFTLAEGAVWQFIDILPDKSTHTSEPQGEYPSMTQLNKLTKLCESHSVRPMVQIDGGISPRHAAQVVAAGANVLVGGSAVFDAPDHARAVEEMRSEGIHGLSMRGQWL